MIVRGAFLLFAALAAAGCAPTRATTPDPLSSLATRTEGGLSFCAPRTWKVKRAPGTGAIFLLADPGDPRAPILALIAGRYDRSLRAETMVDRTVARAHLALEHPATRKIWGGLELSAETTDAGVKKRLQIRARLDPVRGLAYVTIFAAEPSAFERLAPAVTWLEGTLRPTPRGAHG